MSTDPHTTQPASDGSARRIAVGVAGASGTTGAELIGLLAEHPAVELKIACARSHAGELLTELDPGAPALTLQPIDALRPDELGLDVVFVCLPHGKSAEHSARFAEHCRVIDLSGDLRLHDEQLHRRTYGSPRDAQLASAAVYGMTEIHREAIAAARVVANPGCYPTTVVLGLAPLARAGHLRRTVIVDSKSGVSGAGRQPTPTTHFCSAYADVRPYKLGRIHRHVAEMEQELAALAPEDRDPPRVLFSPHLVPVERGLLSTMVVHAPELSLAAAHALYRAHYEQDRFVRLLEPGQAARIRAAASTNRAVIGLHEGGDGEHLIITSAIDNLVKGAAGQAIQNMNLMFDLPETLGLRGSAAEVESTSGGRREL